MISLCPRREENEELPAIMSLSCSDCFSDLLCGEDAGILEEDLPEYSPDLEFPSDIEESIAGFVEEEGDYAPRFDYSASFQSQTVKASSRQESIEWILKVHSFYRFQPLTAYLSVNYLDRFLACRSLPHPNGWPIQLLSVACLSLAAKMEEPLAPTLLDLQVEGAKFIFEPRTIRRMEFLILDALDWRLRSITPFTFIDFFAYKVDSTGINIHFLVSRATQIILTIIKDTSFLDYCPSSVAAAAILCAANEIPNLSLVSPADAEEWCHGLSKDRILNCYKLVQGVVGGNSKRKPPKVLPQLRVTTTLEEISISGDLSSSSASFSNKKRKLNN